MGYLDAKLTARHYQKLVQQDKYMLQQASMQVAAAKRETTTANTNLNTAKSTSLQNINTYHSTQMSTLNNKLADKQKELAQRKAAGQDTSDIDAEITMIKNQISAEQIAWENDKAHMETLYTQTQNEYQNSLVPKETYWELLKEDYTQQKEADEGLLAAAKQAAKEALANLFPKNASGTTTTSST